jgi:hypothetical protein
MSNDFDDDFYQSPEYIFLREEGKMSDQEIVDYYMSHLDCTIKELACMSGQDRRYVKRLLMEWDDDIMSFDNAE